MASGIQADIDAIKAQARKLSAAFKAQDSDKTGLLFTEDCRAVTPGAPVLSGRAGVKLVADQFTKMGIKEVEESFNIITQIGENCYYADGTFISYLEGKKIFDKYNFTQVWRKEKGEWLVFSEAFNSQTPPKPPTA